ncbi:Cyclin B [Carpediemonas membranifera]|uniref:Cyclin B n=1 Tax=Carpediemonas membranifera TaxID=201153 RepID=A0A8J6E1L2_9EUKA|nr:Cyclin B [Carpediemonas membranifera]|eukprot:KAG9393608.1 Cyclin B [Carpediemonas membranifera]
MFNRNPNLHSFMPSYATRFQKDCRGLQNNTVTNLQGVGHLKPERTEHKAPAAQPYSFAKPSSMFGAAGLAAPTNQAPNPEIKKSGSTVVDALNSNDLEDIDLVDQGNPLAAPVYVKEIYAYLRQQEKSAEYRVPTDFISRQTSINAQMRAAIVDWMVDVHHRLKLANESAFLAVNILDRFLAKKQVAEAKLQLVGITSLWLASKFEESYTPSVRSFVRMAPGVDQKSMFSMERMLLKVTGFNLSNPTSITFLRRFAKVADMSTRDRYLAFYLAELANQEAGMAKYLPSEVAAGCVMLAHKIVRRPAVWTPLLTKYSGYSHDDLSAVVGDLKGIVNRVPSSGLKGIYRKYSGDRYVQVSRLISY